ncbi:MAG: hypothetical protein K2I08_03450 [Muribaculaceae bacterium]|nr:hypothetical protein [Muribaculaceae bacterium]
MNRFFTISLKSRLFLFLCFIISTSISVKAEEYKSMIRYDRIWEHISINWGDLNAYYEKFDGSEEINGKTYHRLVSYCKASYNYDAEGKPYILNVDENYFRHEGYLREEDGKVYTLLSNVEYDDNRFSGTLYVPEGNEAHPVDLKEKLLYDFTCMEAESYRGLQVDDKLEYYTEEMNYKVKSIESVEIDGEESKIMRIAPDFEWDYGHGEPIVEGVGIASYGCLTTINFLYLPTCPCMNYIFNRVLSTEGKVLYKNEADYVDIPFGDFLGVGSLTDEPSDAAPIYDLYGRRISTPTAGQLYIQGGKKYIGK